eukprot:6472052-Amphidinium_carterae.5
MVLRPFRHPISHSTTVAIVSRIHAPTVWHVPWDAHTPVTPWSRSCQAISSNPGGYAHPGLSTPASPSTPRANRRQSIHSKMYCHVPEPGLTWVQARLTSSSGPSRKKGWKSACKPSFRGGVPGNSERLPDLSWEVRCKVSRRLPSRVLKVFEPLWLPSKHMGTLLKSQAPTCTELILKEQLRKLPRCLSSRIRAPKKSQPKPQPKENWGTSGREKKLFSLIAPGLFGPPRPDQG